MTKVAIHLDPYPFKYGSQNDRLLQYLSTVGPVTRDVARSQLRIQNITARISELRAELGDSLQVREKRDFNGQRYAEYKLVCG